MLYFAVPIANILVHLICDLPQNEIHKANFDTQPYKYTYYHQPSGVLLYAAATNSA